jgi:hypothetical protein
MNPDDVVLKNMKASTHISQCNKDPYNTIEFQINAQKSCLQFCGGERLRYTPTDVLNSTRQLTKFLIN